jgi:hypothetical protein
MKNLIVAQPSDKDTLNFQGVFQGQEVTAVLVTNRNFEEGKTYAVEFKEYSFSVGGYLIVTATNSKEM